MELPRIWNHCINWHAFFLAWRLNTQPQASGQSRPRRPAHRWASHSSAAEADPSRGPASGFFVGAAARRTRQWTPRRTNMDYAKPTDVVNTMIESGRSKLALAPRDLLIRGMLSGALLFPVGLVMIVLLGLELVTGSFALLPLSRLEHGTDTTKIVVNWSWVFLGNLIGSVIYGVLLAIALTNMGKIEPAGVAARIVAIAEAKTVGYAAFGAAGMVTVFVKAILCNWLVCLGVVLAMCTNSTIGKIAAAWMPIFVFFAQGFEHTVVNMFVIPTGMLLGAKVTVADWWLWNQIPVTLGNIVGGFVCTGLALYLTQKPRRSATPVFVPA